MNEIAIKRVIEAPEVLSRDSGAFLPRKVLASRSHQGILPAMCRLQTEGCDQLLGFGLSAA